MATTDTAKAAPKTYVNRGDFRVHIGPVAKSKRDGLSPGQVGFTLHGVKDRHKDGSSANIVTLNGADAEQLQRSGAVRALLKSTSQVEAA